MKRFKRNLAISRLLISGTAIGGGLTMLLDDGAGWLLIVVGLLAAIHPAIELSET